MTGPRRAKNGVALPGLHDAFTVWLCLGCGKVTAEPPVNMQYHRIYTGEGRTPATMKDGYHHKAASPGSWIKCGPWQQRAAQIV